MVYWRQVFGGLRDGRPPPRGQLPLVSAARNRMGYAGTVQLSPCAATDRRRAAVPCHRGNSRASPAGAASHREGRGVPRNSTVTTVTSVMLGNCLFFK